MFYNWEGSFMNCDCVDRNHNKCWLRSDWLKMAGETALPRVSFTACLLTFSFLCLQLFYSKAHPC